jgi:hypothetical protein
MVGTSQPSACSHQKPKAPSSHEMNLQKKSLRSSLPYVGWLPRQISSRLPAVGEVFFLTYFYKTRLSDVWSNRTGLVPLRVLSST